MEIKIQIEKDLFTSYVVGTLVADEKNSELIIGEIISYDPITGISICKLYENEKSDQ
jgi:hypothetical protein